MTHRVVVIGDALIDELRGHGGVREFVGGAALNLAVGLQRLGVPATLIAMAGDDVDGSHIRSYLHDYGVELLDTPAPRGSARAVSIRVDSGEPQYEFNEAARDRRIRFGEREKAAMTDAAAVVVSCFAFDAPEQVAELRSALAGSTAPLVVDPNPRVGMLTDREEFVRGFEQVAAGAALVKVSADDARLLYRTPLDALRARLIGLGVGAVFATTGADGATIEAGGVAESRPVPPLRGRVVDTMGAGDAALAVAVAALVSGEAADGWASVLERAMGAAAATCRFEGALLRLPDALAGVDLDRIGT